jgi:hypothetical protein
VPILGLREFETALRNVAFNADEAGRIAVTKAAALVERKTKENFVGAHKKGEPHTGGDRPNVVTGTARRSVRSDPIRRLGLGDYSEIVAPRAIYYRRLELGWPTSDGTRGHAVTRPFPSFGPAVEDARREFPKIAADTWRGFLTR